MRAVRNHVVPDLLAGLLEGLSHFRRDLFLGRLQEDLLEHSRRLSRKRERHTLVYTLFGSHQNWRLNTILRYQLLRIGIIRGQTGSGDGVALSDARGDFLVQGEELGE